MWKTGLEARLAKCNSIERDVVALLAGEIVPDATQIREAVAMEPTHRSSRRYAERHGFSVEAVRDVLGLITIAEGRALVCRTMLAEGCPLPAWAIAAGAKP